MLSAPDKCMPSIGFSLPGFSMRMAGLDQPPMGQLGAIDRVPGGEPRLAGTAMAAVDTLSLE